VEKARWPAWQRFSCFIWDLRFIRGVRCGATSFAMQWMCGASESPRSNHLVPPVSIWECRRWSLFRLQSIFAILLGSSQWPWNMDDRVGCDYFRSRFLRAALLYALADQQSNPHASREKKKKTILTVAAVVFEGWPMNQLFMACRPQRNWGRRPICRESLGQRPILARKFLPKDKPGSPFARGNPKPDDIARKLGDYYNLDFPSPQAGFNKILFILETHTPCQPRATGWP